jgi:hypothetical protein
MFLFGGCIYASYPLITNICVCVHVSNCIKNIALALSKQRKRKSKRKKMTSNLGHTNQNDVSITTKVENEWKLDMEESILYDGKPYMFNPPNCKEHCFMHICFWKQWGKYEAKGGNQMVYYNNCTTGPPCCVGHWHIKLRNNGQKQELGYSTGMTPGKGCMSWCCPCGDKVIQNFYDGKGNRLYTIRKKITCTNCMCTSCAPLGLCCATCMDGISWCSNDNFIVLKEQIMDGSGKNVAGEISQLIRIDCEACCFPARIPIRYSVKMNGTGNNSAALVSILPMFYRGMPAPCQCCHSAPATPLTGVKIIDSGRKYTMTRGDFQKILSVAGRPEDMEMER